MKMHSLFLFLIAPLVAAMPGPQYPGAAPRQAAATEFPAQLLQGTDSFNLAIDIYADSRGNFDPCG